MKEKLVKRFIPCVFIGFFLAFSFIRNVIIPIIIISLLVYKMDLEFVIFNS